MTMLDQASPSAEPPLLEVKDLVQHYTLPRESMFKPAGQVQALNGVTAQVMAGRSLGIVGESGSGKSTFARLVMALDQPTSGSVSLLGRDLHRLPADELRRARRDFQMVFQDPYGSLDPRQTVARIVAEPLTALGRMDRATQRQRVAGVLRRSACATPTWTSIPHEFSGGQRQRIAIARALITRPKLIVADEPVSALDVSVQAQVLNLLQDLQDQFGLSYMLISHDLAVVDYLCDEIAVMYLGRIVEQGSPRICSRIAPTPTRGRCSRPCRAPAPAGYAAAAAPNRSLRSRPARPDAPTHRAVRWPTSIAATPRRRCATSAPRTLPHATTPRP